MSTYLDYAAIGRLLEVVQKAGGQIPAAAFPVPGSNQLDPYAAPREWRHTLAQGIVGAYTDFRLDGDWTSDARARSRAKKLAQVAEWSERLFASLKDESLPLSAYLTISTAEMSAKLEELKDAANGALDRMLGDGNRRTSEAVAPLSSLSDDGCCMTATPRFIGRLAEAYEAAFGPGSAKVQKDTYGEPSGPFVEFVMAAQRAVAENGGGEPPVTNTAVAIQKALNRWRTSKREAGAGGQ